MNSFSPINPVMQPTPMDWIEQETRKAPVPFATRSDPTTGDCDVDVARYTSREYFDLEVKNLWSKAWQMACHESEIQQVGDYVTYEVASYSWIIVRSSPTEIKAHANTCLHRGQALTNGCGNRGAFTCPFHGWTWNLDGSLKRITEDWDFPQCAHKDMDLPQAKVATWGGFVFINPDPDSIPFEQYIGNLPAHFQADPLEERMVAVHAGVVVPANWKVAQEAFMESYHVMPTHPQSVPVSDYNQSQIDIWDDCPNSSRLWTLSIAPISDHTKAMSPQEYADFAAETTWREKVTLQPGENYRSALADQRRAEIGAAKGKSVDHLTDAELLDAIQYSIFPNFDPWYGYGVPVAYRFLPNGNRTDSSTMEVYVLAPRNVNEPCPPAPAAVWVPEGDKCANYPALGRLGPIVDQDLANLPLIQRGLENAATNGKMKGIKLATYMEARIRHFHERLTEYVGK